MEASRRLLGAEWWAWGRGHVQFAAVGAEKGCRWWGLCSIFTVVDGRIEVGYTGREDLGIAP